MDHPREHVATEVIGAEGVGLAVGPLQRRPRQPRPHDVAVAVRTQYLADQSEPARSRYAFAYTVTISNRGTVPARLVSRHWIITDAEDNTQEVRGLGVVGQHPYLAPGESFKYSSWCPLPTPTGMMRGEYQMVRSDGVQFDIEIAPFALRESETFH